MLTTAVAAAIGAHAVLAGDSPGLTATACGLAKAQPASPLRLVGNRLQDETGKDFIPYGISLVSGPETTNWGVSEDSVLAQIVASHTYWHANTVRIQIGESNLLEHPTRGKNYNVPFARSINRLICRIVRQGQVPVINDTTIFTGRERGPGKRTVEFWRFMSRRYGNTFPAIFDLFNEPQVTATHPGGHFLTAEHTWRIWRSGGTAGGKRYVGMQTLVNVIRDEQKARNVIWAEEPYYVSADRARLDLLPDHLLHGADIMYAFHKPHMRYSSPSFTQIRTVAARGIPLIDSEWGQFAAIDRPWMCQSDAYTTVPRYLAFLRSASIGVLAWSLQPGALLQGTRGVDTVHDGNDWRYTEDPRQLARPNEMTSTYGCKRRALGQGAGRLLLDYISRYGRPAPPDLFPDLT